MRTTLTIEPAIAEKLRKLVVTRERTLKALVNDALREGLRVLESERKAKRPRFRVEPHDFGGLNPGIDPAKIGQFADEQEDAALVARLHAK
jgi:hypothetical protein